MIDKEQLTRELGLERFDEAEREEIFERYTFAIGSALHEGIADDKIAEFNEITDGNQAVIDAWLASNEPEYLNDPLYRQFTIGYDEDPEKVPADKVFASMAWIRINRPDFAQTVERIKGEFRQALAERA